MKTTVRDVRFVRNRTIHEAQSFLAFLYGVVKLNTDMCTWVSGAFK